MKTVLLCLNFFGSITSVLLSFALLILLVLFASFQSLQNINNFYLGNIYSSIFFEVFILYFAINLLIAIIRKIPSWKYSFPLLLTFTGIELIIAGALYSKHFSIRGELTLSNNKTVNNFTSLNEYDLVITEDAQEQTFSLNQLKFDSVFFQDKNEKKYQIEDIIEKANLDLRVFQGKTANPAIELTYQSHDKTKQFNFWLISNSIYPEVKNEFVLNKDYFLLTNTNFNNNLPLLKIIDNVAHDFLFISPEQKKKEYSFGDYTVRNVVFFDKATIKDNTLTNEAESINPAVSFDIENENGSIEHHTKFAFLPSLPSFHGNLIEENFPISITLFPGLANLPANLEKHIFELTSNGELYYSTYKKNDRKLIKEKDFILLQNNDKLIVKRIFTNAQIRRTAVYNVNGTPAVLIKIKGANTSYSQWLDTMHPLQLEDSTSLQLINHNVTLPFDIKLLDVQKESKTKSILAQIGFQDSTVSPLVRKIITQNHPVSFGGYYFVLSSYSENPASCKLLISRVYGAGYIITGVVFLLVGILTLFRKKELLLKVEELIND